ncbi:putative ribosomal protein L2 domain 2 [Medicago truncatula]|uniref:Putative ribosomal protein L2 domain 2 n=1 Tax=Medicago truncatula TaxID=3880 RepID=G7JR97_MEDTR|nr:uncharacterized protein LOC11414284 [Medicago truncatula]AES87010.1 transcription termination factor NusG, putative [Medicago truncatula]RHN58980.1 putative ribosomal protein L2 domain 2 [Medicago truncatula]
MKGMLTLHLWNPPPRFYTPSLSTKPPLSISATSSPELLTAKERRRLRNERRESNATNWKEEVENKLIQKTKKVNKSWKDELNLDNLMKLGPQWWGVRVSRVKGQYTAEALARSLAKFFPDIEFKVYAPAIHEKKRLKSGSISVKSKPLFPGCIFLRCELNKPLHDYIKEYEGVGGFIGSKVGNTKKQINKPRPVAEDDMEAIFKQAKVEQENADKAFEEEEKKAAVNSGNPNKELESDVSKAIVDSKPKRGSRKTSNQLTITEEASSAKKKPKLVTGSTVQIISGSFLGFAGTLKKLNSKTKMATVHFTMFGKENIVDLDVSEIVPETN